MNNNCYKLEKIIFNNGIFDKSIDATYIIYLLNNGRYNNIIKQLYNISLTKENYILINKGYKKCKKILNEQKPNADLVDCYLTIFNHAKEKNYDNILILEDDFLLDINIKNQYHIDNINNFLLKNKNKDIVYSFGVLPFIIFPYDLYNYKTLFSSGTHAMIYSKQFRNKTLLIDYSKINDWEVFTHSYTNKIIYNIPLCYQLFPITENSKAWKDYYLCSINISKIWNNSIRNMYDYFELDKKVNGYKYFYIFSKIIGIVFIIFILIFLYILLKVFIN